MCSATVTQVWNPGITIAHLLPAVVAVHQHEPWVCFLLWLTFTVWLLSMSQTHWSIRTRFRNACQAWLCMQLKPWRKRFARRKTERVVHETRQLICLLFATALGFVLLHPSYGKHRQGRRKLLLLVLKARSVFDDRRAQMHHLEISSA